MRVTLRPSLGLPRVKAVEPSASAAGATGILSVRPRGDVHRHFNGANAIRSFTVLDYFLTRLGWGGLSGLLQAQAKVVIAGFGANWQEILMPYKKVEDIERLDMRVTPSVQRLVALYPDRFSVGGNALWVRGRISDEQKGMLLWLATEPSERNDVERYTMNSHGEFLLAAGNPEVSVLGIDINGDHISAAEKQLGEWLARDGEFPVIHGDRFYDGGESEGSFWYPSKYSLDRVQFDGPSISKRVTLEQGDLTDLSQVEAGSVRLYFASGVLDSEVFRDDPARAGQVLDEIERVLEPGGVFFPDDDRKSFEKLELLERMAQKFDIYRIFSGHVHTEEIASLLMHMGIISDRQELDDIYVFVKKGGPRSTSFEEEKIDPHQKQVEPRASMPDEEQVWSRLDVIPIDQLQLTKEVAPNSRDDDILAMFKRGFFLEPVVVERGTNRVIDGNRRVQALRDYHYVAVPVMYVEPEEVRRVADGEPFPFRVTNLFFPFEYLRVRDGAYPPNAYAALYADIARRKMAELHADPRFVLRRVSADSRETIFCMDLA